MKRRIEGLPAVYLKAGEMHLTTTPTLVTTVLGSCVSVTMFAPRARAGAICHGLLPSCSEKKSCRSSCAEEFKYVDCSIRRMIEAFRALKVKPEEIQTKLFGGADMITAARRGRRCILNVGRQNIDVALTGIERAGLTLATYDVGGSGGRKLVFFTHTGEVLLKRLAHEDLPHAS